MATLGQTSFDPHWKRCDFVFLFLFLDLKTKVQTSTETLNVYKDYYPEATVTAVIHLW